MDAQSDVDEETENQRAELGGYQHLNARGILARTRCWQCPHGVPFPVCLPVSMSLCRVCMISSLPVFLPVLRVLRVSCSVLYFLTTFLFSFLFFYNFNRHLCHGAY